MDSVLRPRDIQARIRSGETPETVADTPESYTGRFLAELLERRPRRTPVAAAG